MPTLDKPVIMPSLSRLTSSRGAAIGVSFAVHDVVPGVLDAKAFGNLTAQQSVLQCLRSDNAFYPELVATSCDEQQLVAFGAQNALVGAVHIAFSQHLSLSLSPDMLWLAILQGFARHVKENASALEERLMCGSGKHEITVLVNELPRGEQWLLQFANFAQALDAHTIQGFSAELQAEFSTTGPIERAAAQVALMDVFSPYVSYTLSCICGIPSITLEGDATDWERLAAKLHLLRGFEIDDWVDELDVILTQFIRASRGDVDVDWWRRIYKLKSDYGADKVEGWIGCFFPYRKGSSTYQNVCAFKRPVRETSSLAALSTLSFESVNLPPGLSSVGVNLVTSLGTEHIQFVSGFIGVEPMGDRGVRPKIGWAVTRSHFMERAVADWSRQPPSGIGFLPPLAEADQLKIRTRPGQYPVQLPLDLSLFYAFSNGADLYGRGEIFSLEKRMRIATFRDWHFVGSWEDGSYLIENNAITRVRWVNGLWEQQTLALSFSAFLQSLIATDGQAYWQAADFQPPVIEPSWDKFNLAEVRIGQVRKPLEQLREAQPIWPLSWCNVRRPSGRDLSNIPPALAPIYKECDGIVGRGFELFGAEKVSMVEGTQGRWWCIGCEGPLWLIFDIAGDRGFAYFDAQAGKVTYVAYMFDEVVLQIISNRGTSVAQRAVEPLNSGLGKPAELLWPDEQMARINLGNAMP